MGLVISAKISKTPDHDRGPRLRRPAVRVASVEVGVIRRVRQLAAPLEASRQVVVSARVTGQVVQLGVSLGMTLPRGAQVAKIYDDRLKHAVEATQAALKVAKARQKVGEAEFNLARRSLRRIRSLGPKGVTSPAQLESAEAAVLTREAQLEVQRAEVLQAEANQRRAHADYLRTTVRANWSGGQKYRQVARLHVQEGDVVREDEPILTLIEPTPLRANVYLSEADFPYLKMGLRASIASEAYPGQKWPAELKSVASAFDSATRQIQVELEVPNPTHSLVPGMFTSAELELESIKNATIVPQAAITRIKELNGVYALDEEHRVRFVSVSLGIKEGDRIQISPTSSTAWVVEGQKVVTLGHQLLSDGIEVQPEERP